MSQIRISGRVLGGEARGTTIGGALAALCAAAACAATATAADTGADADASGPLQEITVTATRHEESLSKVPISVTALTQDAMDLRGIKDFQDIVRFTPGVNIDNSGTNNISIRGIASTGGAGTTGIYIDDTPIQIRGTAFNPDDALPKSFDIDRVEVLRGPQGTLFGAGSEGGTVRYITTQPSLTRTTMYSREEIADTQDGAPSYEAGAAIGGPLVEGTLGARVAISYRRDGGYIDDISPITGQTTEKNANFRNTLLARVAFLWAPTDKWSFSPSIYYQDQYRNDIDNYWPIYSNPSDGKFVNADPTQRRVPDRFYLTALKIQGDLGFADFISNTSYFHRREQSGYEGTIYNLGYYQTFMGSQTLIDASGIHLPAGALNYTSPSTVDNGQQNITQEFRLQSSDPAAKLQWTTGIFASVNRQTYLEQIHDPMLNELTEALTGQPYTDIFTDQNGNPLPYDPAYPNDSYFLKTDAKDQQYAIFGEVNYAIFEWFKITGGVRFSKNKYSFDTLTGGPQLFNTTRAGSGDNSENATTPRVGLNFQVDPNNLYYFTYAKGFRPGGANNPLPEAACAQDFQSFGISQAPTTYSSDSVQSFEVGAKNNIG